MKGLNNKRVINLSCTSEEDVCIVERLIARARLNRRSTSAEAFVALEYFENNAPAIMLGVKKKIESEVKDGK